MIRKVAPHTTFQSPIYKTSTKHGEYEAGFYSEEIRTSASKILMTMRTPEQSCGGFAGVDSCASHSPLPNSVFENVARLNPGGVYTPECPIRTKYLLADEPIAMIKILFIPREVAQGRWQPPPLRDMSKAEAGVAQFVAGAIALINYKPGNRGWQMPKLKKQQRSKAAGMILSMAGDDDEDVFLEAINQAERNSRNRSSSRASNDSTRSGTTASSPDVESEELQRHRELYKWMKNEHRQMGHSPTAEMLYKGEALQALKQVRRDCRLCGEFDNEEQVRKRGGLQQFAYDRNLKWLFDMIYTRVGRLLKIIDCCTRLRCYELVDDRDGDGAATTAAIRCYQRAKRQFGGKPREMFWDLGSEFLSWRLRKVMEHGNVVVHDIGFKSPHRISKLEVSNREDKKRINKLTHAPFEPFLELVIWGLAQQKVEEEIFNFPYQAIVDEICKIESDSGEHRDHFEAKEQIVFEMEWQANNTPMLGTTITPYNAHYGTFDKGTRDWEDLWEVMDAEPGRDPLPRTQLFRGDQLLGGDPPSDDDDSDEESSSSPRPRRKVHGADLFMRRNERVQNVCRVIILEKDIENFGRRREIVARIYKRGNRENHFDIGQRVFVRRPITKKFLRWVGGIVKGINEEDRTVDVQVGARTQAYAWTDVAHIEPLLSSDGAYEFYPDKHLLELVQDRGGSVVYDEELADGTICREVSDEVAAQADLFTRREDLFSSVRDGQSTQRAGVVGSVDAKYTCERCKKAFTSLRRFLQHSPKCPGKLSSHYKRGVRKEVSFDTKPPELSLAPKHVWRQDLVPTRSSIGNAGGNQDDEPPPDEPPAEKTSNSSQDSWAASSVKPASRESVESVQGPQGSPALGSLDEDSAPSVEELKNLPGRNVSNVLGRLGAFDDLSSDDDIPHAFPIEVRNSPSYRPQKWAAEQALIEKELAEQKAAAGLSERALRYQKRHEKLKQLEATQQWKNTSRKRGAVLQQFEDNEEFLNLQSTKKARADLCSEFRCYTSVGHEQKSESREVPVHLKPGERLINHGYLHDGLLRAMEQSATEMQLVVRKGEIFLTPCLLTPDSDVVRSCDFSVLPQIEKLLGKERVPQVFRLMQGKNTPLFLLSQMLNGRPIREQLGVKDNRDIRYVAVTANFQPDQISGSLQPGKHAFLRWGPKTTPQFQDETAARKQVPGTWVVAVYYEVTSEAHENVEKFAAECKSSSIIVTVEDAAQLGFLCYLYPALALEIAVVWGHKIFGREGDLAQLKKQKKNVVTAGMIADIKEAFLRGKRMIELYDRPEDIEVWCKIPDLMQQLEVPGVPFLGQVRLLDKALYGQCDAPSSSKSYVDPSLWLYYANAQERRVLAAGEEVTMKYYRDKVRELSGIPRDQMQARVLALEDGAEKEQKVLREWTRNTQLVNPQSVRLCDQLLPHFQYEEQPQGGFGVHVDDLLEGGSLIWHLRMFALFDCFELGSFCVLQPAQRDAYIGREIALVPMAYDQQRLREHFAKNQHHMEHSDIRLPEGALEEVSQEELDRLFTKTGVKRDVLPEHYPETEKIKYDPETVLQLHKIVEPVVYYVGQEVYATKIQPLGREEVEKGSQSIKYFEAKLEAGENKFKQKQNKSPLRGRLGELLWLKSNAMVSEGISELASLAHEAEKCGACEEVQGFVEDLNGVIGVAKFREANTKRIYHLGGPGELFVGGAADAGGERIGGTTFLAGRGVPRINCISHWTNKPKRRFSSSTAIEVLAQKACSSELIYMIQLVLDMALVRLGRPFLQITDSRNGMTEPHEKNIKPDFQALQGLMRAKLLTMRHGPGKKMWVDGLTKSFRNGQIFLLHAAVNLGLIDVQMWDIVQEFIEKTLQTEAKKEIMLVDDLVTKMEDDDAEDGEVEFISFDIPLLADARNKQESSSSTGAATSGAVLATSSSALPRYVTSACDYWIEDAFSITRVHGKARKTFFTPKTKEIPAAECSRYLTDRRTTRCEKADGSREVHEDSWRAKNIDSHRLVYGVHTEWRGETVFYKRQQWSGWGIQRAKTEGKLFAPTIDELVSPAADNPDVRTKEEKIGVRISGEVGHGVAGPVLSAVRGLPRAADSAPGTVSGGPLQSVSPAASISRPLRSPVQAAAAEKHEDETIARFRLEIEAKLDNIYDFCDNTFDLKHVPDAVENLFSADQLTRAACSPSKQAPSSSVGTPRNLEGWRNLVAKLLFQNAGHYLIGRDGQEYEWWETPGMEAGDMMEAFIDCELGGVWRRCICVKVGAERSRFRVRVVGSKKLHMLDKELVRKARCRMYSLPCHDTVLNFLYDKYPDKYQFGNSHFRSTGKCIPCKLKRKFTSTTAAEAYGVMQLLPYYDVASAFLKSNSTKATVDEEEVEEKKAVAQDAANAARKRMQEECAKKARLDAEAAAAAAEAKLLKERREFVEEICTSVFGKLQKQQLDMFSTMRGDMLHQVFMQYASQEQFSDLKTKVEDGANGLMKAVREQITQGMYQIEETVKEISDRVGDESELLGGKSIVATINDIDISLRSVNHELAQTTTTLSERIAGVELHLREARSMCESVAASLAVALSSEDETKQQKDVSHQIFVEESEVLRTSVRLLTERLEQMEEKLVELEVEGDDICSECGPEEPQKKGPRTFDMSTPDGSSKKGGVTLEPEEPEEDPDLSDRDRKIIAGDLIPRMKTAERIDMIEWSKLNMIKPKVRASQASKSSYNKWDEIVIMKLGYPPRRDEFTWRLWKEGVWHWARELREVGASFVMLGRNLVQGSFKGYEGEHSVATSAGEARDLVSVMTVLDEHFAPHTRTIQSRIESDLYKIRRLDKQSPMLFLHLLGVIFRREKEIAEGKFTRTEESKVNRALDALGLSRETTQMLRVTINQTVKQNKAFTFANLESEVDAMNLQDYDRYRINEKNQCVQSPAERGETDVLTELLEAIGERLAIDSHGHHVIVNSYFQSTAKGKRAVQPSGGQGYLTQGFLDPGTADPTPLGGTGLQHVGGGGGAAGGAGVFLTPGAPAADPNKKFSDKTVKAPDGSGREIYVPPKSMTAEEKQRSIDASNKFKLKKDPNADWCKRGDFCQNVLTTVKREYWRM
eukprot:g18061.t1